MDNNRGHTRSFSSEKIFQDYRAAQQGRSSTPAAAAAAPPAAAPAVPAAALGAATADSGTPVTTDAVAAALVSNVTASPQPAAGGGVQLSSFDEELQDDAPSLGGGAVRLSDPLGVS